MQAPLEERGSSPLSRIHFCYQCKKCSSGCPVSFEMDRLPHQIIRLLQLDATEAIVKSNTMWVCASCQTCTARCPNDIDIAGVMDSCRHMSVAKGVVAEKGIELFHRVFLREVKRLGRLHEVSMIGKYKLLSGHWLRDNLMGARMFARSKLKLLPSRVKGRAVIRKLFSAAEQKH